MAVAVVAGFFILIAPHMVRLAVGPDRCCLMPASAMASPIFALGGDLGIRSIAAPAEMPLGILSAIVGTLVSHFSIDRARRSLASGF